jgi:hypothetical protein
MMQERESGNVPRDEVGYRLFLSTENVLNKNELIENYDGRT